MSLRVVQTILLPDQVFAQLLGQIVGGGYGSGATLPSERVLANTFAVNRHVVREALKRLEQVGLVSISQGEGTKVLDFRHSAGLDVLALIAEHAEAIDDAMPLLVPCLEMRASIGADVARLCAERADADTTRTLTELSEQLAAVGAGPELLPLDRAFWQQVLDGAENLAYQLAFNSLIRAVDAVPEFSVGWLAHELSESDFRRPIAAAIAAGDGDAAAAAARTGLAAPPELAQAVPDAQRRATR